MTKLLVKNEPLFMFTILVSINDAMGSCTMERWCRVDAGTLNTYVPPTYCPKLSHQEDNIFLDFFVHNSAQLRVWLIFKTILIINIYLFSLKIPANSH